MRTIITHFYNEEYLLPWWLNHHKKLFDHGILIDYKSTDRSIEIIKEICPNWEIVESKHKFFDARNNDLEVADLEKNIPGWKMSLTVTEFLMGGIDKLCVDSNQRLQHTIPVIIFADYDPDGNLDVGKPLWEQIKMGLTFINHPDIAWPSRSLHNFNDIVYPGGRHFHPHSTTEALIFKYSNCLIGPEMIKRRLQINPRISARDKEEGIGSHHCVTIDTIKELYNFNIGSRNPIDCTHFIDKMIKQTTKDHTQWDYKRTFGFSGFNKHN